MGTPLSAPLRDRTLLVRSLVYGPAVLWLAASMVASPALARAVDLDRTVAFNIEPQPIGSALIEFSRQAHIQVVIAPDVAGTAEAPAFNGTVSARVALDILLRNSGLKYAAVGKSVSVTRVGGNEVSSVASDRQPSMTSDPNEVTNDGAAALEEVVITSPYEFLNADTSGATNLPLPIEKVPQSISLVSSAFVKAADLKTLGEIAEYTPGAINSGNDLGAGSNITLRGFPAGRAVDGINILGLTNYSEPDGAIFDRLEIVKGPSSVVYGVSSPGGLVNVVTKSATPDTVNYVLAQASSWSSYRVEGQGAGALDAAGNVRIIGVAVRDQGDSYINFIGHTKTVLYGGLNVDLGNSVTAYLHGGYEKFVRTAFDGIPAEADGSPAPLPRSFFIGSKNVELSTSTYHAEGDVTWHATDMLNFSLKGNLENHNTTGAAAYSSGLAANGDITLAVLQLNETRNDNYGIGLSSIYRLDELGLKSSFVSLAVLRQSSRTTLDWGLGGYPTGNIFGGETALMQAFDSLLAAGGLFPYTSDTYAETTTVSAQSMLQLVTPLSLLLGTSYSKPDVTLNTGGVYTDFSIKGQLSYRAGLTYEILPRLNAYASFSQSFSPQTSLSCSLPPGATVCSSVSVLPPLTGEQYEGGVKYRSIGGRLLLTGALFHITEKNQPVATVPVNGIDYFAPVGEVTHKGFELEALGQIAGQWQINAGYTYLSPKITAEGASQAAIIGESELFLPKQTVNLYTTYTLPRGILRGLSLGVGVRYVSSEQTSYRNPEANSEAAGAPGVSVPGTKDLPSYTLVDATVSYAVDKWLVQLNAHNIFDKHYFINNYGTLFYGNTVGTPANVALSVRRQF